MTRRSCCWATGKGSRRWAVRAGLAKRPTAMGIYTAYRMAIHMGTAHAARDAGVHGH